MVVSTGPTQMSLLSLFLTTFADNHGHIYYLLCCLFCHSLSLSLCLSLSLSLYLSLSISCTYTLPLHPINTSGKTAACKRKPRSSCSSKTHIGISPDRQSLQEWKKSAAPCKIMHQSLVSFMFLLLGILNGVCQSRRLPKMAKILL